MADLTNILDSMIHQKIGIFFKDKEWGNIVFDNICKSIPKEKINRICKRKEIYGSYVELVTGTIIEMIIVNGNCRAKRVNKAIIQSGLDRNTIHALILPRITIPQVLDEFGKIVY